MIINPNPSHFYPPLSASLLAYSMDNRQFLHKKKNNARALKQHLFIYFKIPPRTMLGLFKRRS